MKNVLSVVVLSSLLQLGLFAGWEASGLKAGATGAYKSGGSEANNGLVIKPRNVMMAEQLAPAVKNGVCLSRDLVSSDPELNEAMRSYKNGQGNESQMTLQNVETNPDCHKLPYDKTLLHDFNNQFAEACNLTPDMRAACYLLAGLEHLGAIPKGTILNVDGEHNVKFVCANGEEHVFDRSGKLISNGINEGTFNLADPENEPVKHIFADMLAAVQALPQKSSMAKDEFYSFLKEYIDNKKITIGGQKVRLEDQVCSGGLPLSGTVKIPDLSNLISMLKQMIAYLRRINAMGQKPSDEESVGYNRLLSFAQEEFKKISEAIEVTSMQITQMNIPKQEQRRIAEELGKQMAERIKPYCDTIESLQRQIEAKGYGHFGHVSFNPKSFR